MPPKKRRIKNSIIQSSSAMARFSGVDDVDDGGGAKRSILCVIFMISLIWVS